MDPLPRIDEHARSLRVDVEAAWEAVAAEARGLAERHVPLPFAAAWGLRPAAGFEVAESVPPLRVVLRGEHRFARYELAFLVDQTPDGSVVRARTSAVFPGPQGKIYRALVIGSGGHVLAVHRILRKIARRAASPAPGSAG